MTSWRRDGRAARVALAILASASACAGDDARPATDTDTDGPPATSGSTAPAPETTTTPPPDDATTASPLDDTSTTSPLDGTTTTGDDDATTGRPSVTVDDPIRVAYLADEARRGTDELWLRDESDYDIGPMRISHTLPAEAFISPFFPVSSDGRWLLYRMIQPGPGSQHELWAVDISVAQPEAPFRVDDTPALIHEHAITPDAAAAVWIGADGIHTSSLLAASPGPVLTHTPAPSAGGTYGVFEIHADSDTVAYTADPDGTGTTNAFALTLATDAIVQLSDLTLPGTAVEGSSLVFAGDALVYQADRDVAEPELFWASLAGTPPLKINEPVVDESIRTERVAPGGGAMAYWMGFPGPPDLGAVFLAALPDTGPTAPIDVHAGQPGTPQQGRIVWAADATAILYSVLAGDRLEGWLAETDAGVPDVPQRITGDVPADGDHLVVHVFDATGNVFYIATTDTADELFFVDRSGGTPSPPVRISPPPLGTGLSGDLRFSADGTTAVFTGFIDSAAIRDLYRMDLSAAAPWPVDRIANPLRDGEGVTPTPILSSDGSHIVYTTTNADESTRDLFDAPPGGTGFRDVLPISEGGHVTAFAILP